jgi:hypothetical protein
MTALYFVWRWRGTRWLPDCWDVDGSPIGELTIEAARERVAYLLAARLRWRRQVMWPPPVITLGEVPRWTPRRKEKKHRYSAAELLNGHTYGPPIVLREGVVR